MLLTKLPNGNTIATIEGDTHIGRWAIEAGRVDHDQNMLPLLRPYIPKGGTVVDAGAFIGDHTVFYADCVGPRGQVHAFEPNADAFECLHYNTKGLPVTLHNAGLGIAPSTASIAHSDNAGASHLTEGTSCRIITLDSLSLPRLDFFKLDVEGFEVMALRGARETIQRCRPVMLIEVNAGALARQGYEPLHIFAELHKLGYQWRNVYAKEPLSGDQFDILCEPT
jgi:FkbM family methyltransferase